MRVWFRHFVLACLLVLSQQGMLVHEVGHHATSRHGTQREVPRLPAAEKSCHLCLASVQFGSAAPTSVPPLRTQSWQAAHGTPSAEVTTSVDRVLPRSRDPPRLRT